MKRILIIFIFAGMSLTALLFGVSCSNQTPNTALSTPLNNIATSNPAWTATFTPTPTPVYTNTPTPVPYSTPISGFSGPYGLAIDPRNNNIYVGDTGDNLIKQFSNGLQNSSWPLGKSKASNGLPFSSPKAIAVDSSGYLYVVSGSNNGVSRLDPNGNFLVQYTNSMSGPLGLAVTVSGAVTTLYVSDTGNSRILSISIPSGGFSTLVSSLTYEPQGLAIGNGDLFVAGNDGHVHIYALPSGSLASPVSIIPAFNNPYPAFNNPYAVALDSSNDLFVSDTGNHQVEEFTFGNYENSPSNIIGVGSLSNPEGIVLDSSANVYVVDSGNGQLFQFP